MVNWLLTHLLAASCATLLALAVVHFAPHENIGDAERLPDE